MAASAKYKSVKSDINKFFHLDLKGGPPKVEYLKRLWLILKQWNISGVLIEWEDCFPYKDGLQILSNNAYSADEAVEIIDDIQKAGLKIIPLVQTMGHLEFVLKHETYLTYREVPIYPSSMCPSNPESLNLINQMVDQVISFHKRIEHFHIGADEVWHMGVCERCKKRMDSGIYKEDLFLMHIKAVCENIKNKWPDISIIMWDDMLRTIDISSILGYQLNSLIEPMVWHYNSSESFNLPSGIWEKYSCFPGAWAAGAFKGASGGSQLIPLIDKHVSNTQQWARSIEFFKSPVRGFVLTGWSRYDHFAAMCELLPCGLLSLGVCLRVFNGELYNQDLMSLVDTELKELDYNNSKTKFKEQDKLWKSNGQVVLLISQLIHSRESASSILNSDQLQTWMNEWQISNNKVNPMQLVPMIPVLQKTFDEFNEIEKSLKEHLVELFKIPTITEWIETYISILRSRIKKTLATAESIVNSAKSALLDKNLEMELN